MGARRTRILRARARKIRALVVADPLVDHPQTAPETAVVDADDEGDVLWSIPPLCEHPFCIVQAVI